MEDLKKLNNNKTFFKRFARTLKGFYSPQSVFSPETMDITKKRNERLHGELAARPDSPLVSFREEFVDLPLAVRYMAKYCGDLSWLIFLIFGVSFVWMPLVQDFIMSQDELQYPGKMNDIQKLITTRWQFTLIEHRSNVD